MAQTLGDVKKPFCYLPGTAAFREKEY